MTTARARRRARRRARLERAEVRLTVGQRLAVLGGVGLAVTGLVLLVETLRLVL